MTELGTGKTPVQLNPQLYGRLADRLRAPIKTGGSWMHWKSNMEALHSDAAEALTELLHAYYALQDELEKVRLKNVQDGYAILYMGGSMQTIYRHDDGTWHPLEELDQPESQYEKPKLSAKVFRIYEHCKRKWSQR